MVRAPDRFARRLRQGNRPTLRYSREGGPPPVSVGAELVADAGPGGAPTLWVRVTQIYKEGDWWICQYMTFDHRPNLLRKALPSRPGRHDPSVVDDREAGRESAYTDSTKRAMAGGHTRKGDEDIFVGPEPEAVDEEDLDRITIASRRTYDAIHHRRRTEQQIRNLDHRMKELARQARDAGRDPDEVTAKIERRIAELEAELDAGHTK